MVQARQFSYVGHVKSQERQSRLQNTQTYISQSVESFPEGFNTCLYLVSSYTLWWSEGILSYLPVAYDEGITSIHDMCNNNLQYLERNNRHKHFVEISKLFNLIKLRDRD